MDEAAPADRRPVVVVGDVGLDVIATMLGPFRQGSDTPSAVATHPGGAGANTAAWLAAYGMDVTVCGRVGDDAAGRAAVGELEASGVRCAVALDARLPTGLVVVVVDESGERSLFPARGANSALTEADCDLDVVVSAAGGRGAGRAACGRETAGLAAGPAAAGRETEGPADGHLHVSGYVLLDEGSRAAGLAALAQARARGWTTSVDPQAASLVERVGAAAFLEWVRGVDLLLPNEGELTALDGATAALGSVRAVAVTAGPAGARWVAEGVEVTVPAPAVDLVDPTGCGDAFDAGLLAAWLSGADPESALRAGVAAGSRAATTPGARPPAGPPF
ncbi:MAG TPA: PfkB family carbohydrate kinase [Dermatophilaceae bacterium]|nr:PfkB family carbohydrate kinase [Dermatophilaceae bacterium]